MPRNAYPVNCAGNVAFVDPSFDCPPGYEEVQRPPGPPQTVHIKQNPGALSIHYLGYLLDSGDPYILWSTEAAFSVPPMMDLYGTGSMATACCTSR